MTDPNDRPGGGLEAPRGGRPDVLDAGLLRELRAINERGVALLQEQARRQPVPPASPAAATLGAWLELDPMAARRLASQPFLLFGIGLEDPARWSLRGQAPAVPGAGPAASVPGGWPEGAAYARVLTHYAWHLARTAPRTAALVAGMAPETGTALRECPVERLDALAERSARWLQLRWHDQPSIWAGLFAAALRPEGPEAAPTATLRALQRLGAAHVCAAVAEPAAAPGGSGADQRGPTLW